ncbi:MAG: hypothetical protein JJE04_14125 [Acidobacteriia bacterium]|nr:hypothetical protein [Terriglobia bacterium]
MKLEYTKSALAAPNNRPVRIRKAFYKQADFLVQDLHYPSLRAKKYDEFKDLWQARGAAMSFTFVFMSVSFSAPYTN